MKIKIKKNTLKNYLLRRLEPEIIHELCIQWDNGSFEKTMDDLLKQDAINYPNEYYYVEKPIKKSHKTMPKNKNV